MPHKSSGSGAKTQGARCHPKGAADTGFASQIIFRRQDFGQARLGWGYVGRPGWGEGEEVEGGKACGWSPRCVERRRSYDR